MDPIEEYVGVGRKGVAYDVADTEVAAGSTLGSPKCVCIVKATGAIEKIYATDVGETVFETVVVHHWDRRTGVALGALPGSFKFHPEHQEHHFTLSNGIEVAEDIFVLSGVPTKKRCDPPAIYYAIELHNPTAERVEIDSSGFVQMRGSGSDIACHFSKAHNALVATEAKGSKTSRVFGCSTHVAGWETTDDAGKAVAKQWSGRLSNEAIGPCPDPLGVLHVRHRIDPGQRRRFYFLLTFASSPRAALRTFDALPNVDAALRATREYFARTINRAVVLTPDDDVNRGVLWAKANMLRTMLLAPTGWSFVNDPSRSNNSVARDTAWFAFGADYVVPDFAEASLLWYAEHLEKDGMVVEYYDIRNGKTADYKLNINDNTPLLIIALWHHFNTTGDRAFLKRTYPAALKAAKRILSQRDDRGLVWCTADGTADYGIVGWRNVIEGYRLSGATTELNSECYAALLTVSHMARVLGEHERSRTYRDEADALRAAINEHLFDAERGLYYLCIDLAGKRRTDVTCDLIFPVMFGVSDDEVGAGIVSRLAATEFWSDAGMRTVPRNAIDYGPTHGYGLLGGVWVGVAFWYAFAAARFNPTFMGYALSQSFRHYAADPRRNNTVPGQFSEWLHGETLVNRGMMLSPWFPPRYLWAAIEGAAGLDLSGGEPSLHPKLSTEWQWLGVRDLPFRGKKLTWFVVLAPEMQIYTNYRFQDSAPYIAYETDLTANMHISGEGVVGFALRDGAKVAILLGNTTERTTTAAFRIEDGLSGSYAVRSFNSLRGAWVDGQAVGAAELAKGIPLQLEQKGFCVLELSQEA
ncbi:MAG: hypothetical protein M3R30_06820 [Candidatus Eremiobacteraeota bacterium]|nr:hypothetical protein [Candidatus Eremiobacteraeota bacterium]